MPWIFSLAFRIVRVAGDSYTAPCGRSRKLVRTSAVQGYNGTGKAMRFGQSSKSAFLLRGWGKGQSRNATYNKMGCGSARLGRRWSSAVAAASQTRLAPAPQALARIAYRRLLCIAVIQGLPIASKLQRRARIMVSDVTQQGHGEDRLRSSRGSLSFFQHSHAKREMHSIPHGSARAWSGECYANAASEPGRTKRSANITSLENETNVYRSCLHKQVFQDIPDSRRLGLHSLYRSPGTYHFEDRHCKFTSSATDDRHYVSRAVRRSNLTPNKRGDTVRCKWYHRVGANPPPCPKSTGFGIPLLVA
jgi:hypothetical protein